jgi:hypothetical protein
MAPCCPGPRDRRRRSGRDPPEEPILTPPTPEGYPRNNSHAVDRSSVHVRLVASPFSAFASSSAKSTKVLFFLVGSLFTAFTGTASAFYSYYWNSTLSGTTTKQTCCQNSASGLGYRGNVHSVPSGSNTTHIYAYATSNSTYYRNSGQVFGPVSEANTGVYLKAYRYCHNWGSAATSFTSCYVAYD